MLELERGASRRDVLACSSAASKSEARAKKQGGETTHARAGRLAPASPRSAYIASRRGTNCRQYNTKNNI